MVLSIMSESSALSLLRQRRDAIRDWLDDEAPYTDADQRHLDSDSAERAYWHHGYQAALNDVLNLLMGAGQKSGTGDIPS